MKDICILSSLEKVKSVCDPLRIEILQLLIKQSLTSKQIADKVKQSSSKIHYHVKELEKHGLIALDYTLEKGGILEKYYRAIANNYFIDQSLGDYFEKNETKSVQFVTQDILSWRRVHRLKVDVEALARKIVKECLRINPNEVVGLMGGIDQMDLAEPLAIEIQRAGAYPLLCLETLKMKSKVLGELEPCEVQKHFRRLAETLRPVTTMIMLEHIVTPSLTKGISQERVEIYRNAWVDVRNELFKRKVKWAFLGYPTQILAEEMNTNFLQLHDMFWKGIDVNYNELEYSAQYVAEVLTKGTTVKIESEQGTNLVLSISGRRPMIDDGIISDDDIKSGDTVINLPSGEVYIAPVEDSVEGVAFFNLVHFQGEAIEGVRLDFAKGKVVGFSAKKNEAKLKEFFESGEEGRRVLGELGIGLNPWIRDIIGYQVYDTKQLGSINLALGENKIFGGKNSASIIWPMVMNQVNLWVDDIPMIENEEIVENY
ncbi:aminopeptidase [Desulfitobacterium sp.]|uniref:aminopeptidase n=1 Tax=Desulfitobacterium sp. TaxID=49981 RepID=UPI002C5CABAD|nr:aminopeptidase [Desulfitobacterium sp.]HVJ50357.1 aminopeptidase [Desulfitobacterium sp.]